MELKPLKSPETCMVERFRVELGEIYITVRLFLLIISYIYIVFLQIPLSQGHKAGGFYHEILSTRLGSCVHGDNGLLVGLPRSSGQEADSRVCHRPGPSDRRARSPGGSLGELGSEARRTV